MKLMKTDKTFSALFFLSKRSFILYIKLIEIFNFIVRQESLEVNRDTLDDSFLVGFFSHGPLP